MSNSGNDDLTLDTVFVTGQQQGGSIVYQGMQWQGFGPNSIYNDAFDFAQFEDDGFDLNDPSPDDLVYGLKIERIEDADKVTLVITTETPGFFDYDGDRLPGGPLDSTPVGAGKKWTYETDLYGPDFEQAYATLMTFVPWDDGYV